MDCFLGREHGAAQIYGMDMDYGAIEGEKVAGASAWQAEECACDAAKIYDVDHGGPEGEKVAFVPCPMDIALPRA